MENQMASTPKNPQLASRASYDSDFKRQLSSKVLSRIEKRYLTVGSLSDVELKAVTQSESAQERAKLEKVATGSVLMTSAFIVSRLPLLTEFASNKDKAVSYT